MYQWSQSERQSLSISLLFNSPSPNFPTWDKQPRVFPCDRGRIGTELPFLQAEQRVME